MKEKLLVSSCLLGIHCKYSGGHNRLSKKKLDLLNKYYNCIPVCPEQMGGLSTPRNPSEISVDSGRVITNLGEDVTDYFEKGAKEVCAVAKIFEVKKALLKSKSPSCGVKTVYDGTFQSILISGMGLTAKKLLTCGLILYDEMDFFQENKSE